MISLDVNVLVYAHRPESADHSRVRDWLEAELGSGRAFGVASHVLSGFIRVVTHSRVFTQPTPLATALAFADTVRERPNRVELVPGGSHWSIFTDLCRAAGAKGNDVPDAFLAALAIETGSELITTDRGFGRFAGLRWRHPLEET